MSSTDLHEPADMLEPRTRDLHRAITSLMEEMEAVDWYQQRIDASDDDELRAILAHNRDEEKEHACMMIEWIRRQDEVFDRQLRRFLFTDGPIVEQRASANASAADDEPSLAIGSMRERGAA